MKIHPRSIFFVNLVVMVRVTASLWTSFSVFGHNAELFNSETEQVTHFLPCTDFSILSLTFSSYAQKMFLFKSCSSRELKCGIYTEAQALQMNKWNTKLTSLNLNHSKVLTALPTFISCLEKAKQTTYVKRILSLLTRARKVSFTHLTIIIHIHFIFLKAEKLGRHLHEHHTH